jgi:hypothetical protein
VNRSASTTNLEKGKEGKTDVGMLLPSLKVSHACVPTHAVELPTLCCCWPPASAGGHPAHALMFARVAGWFITEMGIVFSVVKWGPILHVK